MTVDATALFETVEFNAVPPEVLVLITLETNNAFPYARKLEATKKSVAVLLVNGFWKLFTRSSSLVIKTLCSAGPHLKWAANPASVVETAGTMVVRSISDTLTPGET